MSKAPLRQLVEAASAAPSVHNVQPARWRIEGHALLLLEDMTRRLIVGDPTGNDAELSLGAAAEGLRLAASRAGLQALEDRAELPDVGNGLRAIARYRFEPGGAPDPLAGWLEARASWRGDFAERSDADRMAAQALTGDDAIIVTDPDALVSLGRLFDRASYGFMRNDGFRRELRGWMRLRRDDPRWAVDGLNAEAMALSRAEAAGAGLVLGPLFGPLDRLRLAPILLAEGRKVAQAAAVVLFHRPRGEHPFESGKRFHRLWLAIERAGMGAAVLAALSDDRDAAATLTANHAIPAGHRLVSAFRIGRRPGTGFARARLPLEALFV